MASRSGWRQWKFHAANVINAINRAKDVGLQSSMLLQGNENSI